ncbi:MAG: histidine phosphatase family protein [Nocardioides sp.]|nr:histidine phosphatase family protein [Nocardioides sp.]
MSSLQCATTLVLARHGEAEYESSTWEVEGGSLTPVGRAQAATLVDRLASRRVAHVWTSTLARAVQTAEIAAAALGVAVTTREGLVEFAPGDCAGTPLSEDPFAETYAAWLAGDLERRVPGGESGAAVVARVRGVLEEIVDTHRGETVLVVSHGGALRLAVPLLTRVEAGPHRIHNCAAIEIEADDDAWVCRSWDPAPEEG